nr:CbbQ/NirQ/NorQ C-terminal domain-containing protein [Chromatiaceae bacterium]
GVEPRAACQGAVALALTDDEDLIAAVNELIAALF